jgi:hypothetical protein
MSHKMGHINKLAARLIDPTTMTINDMTISLSDILVAVLTIVAGGLGYIIKEQKEKIKTIQNQLSDKKYKVYHELYSIFFDLLKQQKDIQEKNDIDIGNRLIDVKKDLLIYAPDTIVKKFLEWNKYINNKPGDIKHILIFLEIFTLIRKDMGQSKSEITGMDILRSIMTTDEEFDKMKIMLQ